VIQCCVGSEDVNANLMQLQMKTRCGTCGANLAPDGEAYICSFECTYCAACARESKETCPNCGGELVRRPQRESRIESTEEVIPGEGWISRPWVVWAMSFSVWGLVTLALSAESYEWWRSRGYPMRLSTTLGAVCAQILTYAPLTPIAFALALRFRIERKNWLRRALLHLLFAIVFSAAHVALRGVTPFAMWDAKLGRFISGIWNSQTHVFQIQWRIFGSLLLANIVEDITFAYVPTLLVAQILLSYRKLRDHELHSAKLETQLTRTRLQVLKSHLQPHFLFNTMHSISALMLTDTKAADRMMTRLSDLLRMSLENNGTQMVSLSRELEFVNTYLEIEKMRLGERLRVHFDVASETLDAGVPSLVLQPIVENAIKHGISGLTSGGHLWISASHEGADLCLIVRDNGRGLSNGSGKPQKVGLGLGATRERLQTLYGQHQSLEMHNAPTGGAEICVRIPFQLDTPTAQ